MQNLAALLTGEREFFKYTVELTKKLFRREHSLVVQGNHYFACNLLYEFIFVSASTTKKMCVPLTCIVSYLSSEWLPEKSHEIYGEIQGRIRNQFEWIRSLWRHPVTQNTGEYLSQELPEAFRCKCTEQDYYRSISSIYQQRIVGNARQCKVNSQVQRISLVWRCRAIKRSLSNRCAHSNLLLL